MGRRPALEVDLPRVIFTPKSKEGGPWPPFFCAWERCRLIRDKPCEVQRGSSSPLRGPRVGWCFCAGADRGCSNDGSRTAALSASVNQIRWLRIRNGPRGFDEKSGSPAALSFWAHALPTSCSTSWEYFSRAASRTESRCPGGKRPS